MFWFQNGDICDTNSGYKRVISGYIIDVICYYIIWIDNGSILPEVRSEVRGEISNSKSIARLLHP